MAEDSYGYYGTGVGGKEILIGVAAVELLAAGFTELKFVSLTAPKYADPVTGALVTDKAAALKAGTGGATAIKPTYIVAAGSVTTTLRNKTNLDAALAANQITNYGCKLQSFWIYPVLGVLNLIEDCDFEAFSST